MARAAIYVDGSNFFKYCEQLHHIYAYRIEWDRFLVDLARGREIVHANYYDCPKNEREVPGQARLQKSFFSQLRSIPWMKLHFARLERRRGHLVEKAVDVKIAVDMVLAAVADEYDHCFLLSADGDFTPAVRAVQSFGKRVLVATPGSSHQLRQAADVFIRIDSTRLSRFLRKRGGP